MSDLTPRAVTIEEALTTAVGDVLIARVRASNNNQIVATSSIVKMGISDEADPIWAYFDSRQGVTLAIANLEEWYGLFPQDQSVQPSGTLNTELFLIPQEPLTNQDD